MQSGFELRKFLLPEIVLGADALNYAGTYAANFNARQALVVTDPGVRAAGWTDRVLDSLRQSGLPCVVFDEVTPNPKDYEVMAGAEVYGREGCDLIVAVGGGSPIDCAKAIGIVSTNHRHIVELVGVDEVGVPGPPMICAPTTAGTSADISQFCIIVDTSRKVKVAIVSKSLVPDVSLIDPCTTTTLSDTLTGVTAFDALVHAIEAHVSNACSPLTDLNALEAVRLISRHLPAVLQEPRDMRHRDALMLASLLAGAAFSNASLGLVHAMAHCVGGLLDAAHGECNAALLQHVVRFNYPAAPSRYDAIGDAMGLPMLSVAPEERLPMLLNGLAALRAAARAEATLGELGVTREHLGFLAEAACKDICIATNPRAATPREVEQIYGQAL